MDSLKKRSTKTYCDILLSKYESRKSRNSQYSLRAFALSLDLHPSELCRIMKGRTIPSVAATTAMIQKLRLAHDETVTFVSSVLDRRYNRSLELITRSLSV